MTEIVTRRGFPGVFDMSGEWAPLPIEGGQDMSDDDILGTIVNGARTKNQTARQKAEASGDWDTVKALDESEAAYGAFDKQLDQSWKIAQLGESGANSRASTAAGASRYAANASAGASRYASDASVKNAKLAAETQRYGIDTSRLTDQEKIALDRELGLGGLGVDLVKTAASLSGPENYLDYLSLLRGGRGMGGAPYFLGGLTGSGGAPPASLGGFDVPGGPSTPLTMDSILRGLGGGGAGGVMNDGSMSGADQQAQQFTQNVGSLLSGGAHKFAQGSLERLNPSELGLFSSAAGKAGWNWNDIASAYKRAQIGQGSASAA